MASLPKAADAYAQTLEPKSLTPHYETCVNNIIGAIKNKKTDVRCSQYLSYNDTQKLEERGYVVRFVPKYYSDPSKDPEGHIVSWRGATKSSYNSSYNSSPSPNPIRDQKYDRDC